MESVFEKYSNSIVRSEYNNYLPLSKLNLNNVNKKTVFKIDEGDGFLAVKNAKYDISGKYIHANDGQNFGDNANIKLIDNFVGHLFSQIEVKKHNKLLDEIEYPGQASTVKGTVSFSLDNNGPTINSGFQSKFTGGGNFQVLGNLSNLGLGFFKDIKFPIYKGGFEITFTRNGDNDALYRWAKKKEDGSFDEQTRPHEGKIIIEDFIIRIPIIEYDDISKVQLISELKTLSQQNHYNFIFKSWQCIQQKNISGKTLNLDITNNYRNIRNPLFGMVAFQTNRLDNQDKETSAFDHCNVRNIWFEINGKRYPEELENLDWDNGKYSIAYDMYMDYKRVFYKTHLELPLIYLNPDQFKKGRPIYVIDLSRQPENISESRNNIILHVDFDKNIDPPSGNNEGTIAYICMVSLSEFSYDIINNTIKENI